MLHGCIFLLVLVLVGWFVLRLLVGCYGYLCLVVGYVCLVKLLLGGLVVCLFLHLLVAWFGCLLLIML